jgi:hypothetical protein
VDGKPQRQAPSPNGAQVCEGPFSPEQKREIVIQVNVLVVKK